MIIEEIKNIKSEKKDLKSFGLTIGIVLLLISAYLFYRQYASALYFAGGGAILIAFGLLFPKPLLPLQKGWMTLAVVLGFIMTRVILSVLFYLVITPIGLIARLSGKDFLDLKRDNSAKSYWNYREIKEYNKIDTERQF